MKNALLIWTGVLLSGILTAQTTLTLQPGASAGCDATLGFHTNYNKDLNYGDQPHIKMFCVPGYSGGNNTCRALISFDLAKIPAGATITSAKLTLYAAGKINDKLPGHYGNNTVTISRVTSPWTEFGVKWNTAPSFTSKNAVALQRSTDPNQNYTVDVLLLVKDMIAAKTPGYGFYFALNKEDPASPAAMCFNSSDHPDASRHPKLEIVYTMPGLKKSAASSQPPRKVVAASPGPAKPSDIRSDSVMSQDSLVIKTGELTNALIKVYAADGKLVKSIQYKGVLSTYYVPIGDLPKGTYTIDIHSDKEKGTLKFVKKE